jgi:hypothetical protein
VAEVAVQPFLLLAQLGPEPVLAGQKMVHR